MSEKILPQADIDILRQVQQERDSLRAENARLAAERDEALAAVENLKDKRELYGIEHARLSALLSEAARLLRPFTLQGDYCQCSACVPARDFLARLNSHSAEDKPARCDFTGGDCFFPHAPCCEGCCHKKAEHRP